MAGHFLNRSIRLSLLTAGATFHAAQKVSGRGCQKLTAHGASLPPFTAGSHNDMRLPSNLLRQYSISSSPADTSRYVIAVKPEPQSRGGSSALHDQIEAGSALTIGLPRNNFELDGTAQYTMLAGAGIVITPILSMALFLQQAGRSFEIEYFCRSLEHVPFLDIFGGNGSSFRAKLHFGLDASATRNRLAARYLRWPAGSHLYMCGPASFMEAVAAVTFGSWPVESVHSEHF